jgi:hypothetical protein
VVEGRERVAAIEGSLWEMREAYELKLENAGIQLKATQVCVCVHRWQGFFDLLLFY